ncbi:hypothetical protein L226DRAFT_539113 [Lentinus tigrinus ALCF2SS1-7]|uniref:uncharacterized protein n=1 Tax=Lentinus tigrinus ALCF2SS1-7 TaxID=1328758 RepID=UPI001165EAAB|nr:hypothetical protein L226DRAFT_539113 [Lentinus tigrinus ALCF2SS1-7]
MLQTSILHSLQAAAFSHSQSYRCTSIAAAQYEPDTVADPSPAAPAALQNMPRGPSRPKNWVLMQSTARVRSL